MNDPASLSVIVVAYRSLTDLERCLPTLFREGYGALEVIVVDNNPGDGTAAWLGRTYPQVKVLANPANSGYAGGNNLGLAAATGEFVLILNPDTELHPGTLGALVEAARRHPDALITAKLLQPDGTLNACGLQMHYTGVTSCRGLGRSAAAHAGVHPVPLLSGAAFIASNEVLKKLGGFDESYFMYHEDVDLSLRAKLHGYRILCAGDARITHHYTLSMSPTKLYYLERNRLLTVLRVYEAQTLRQLAPALLLTELLTWAFAFLKGPRYLRARARTYSWLWRKRGNWRAEREVLQRERQVADGYLLVGSLSKLPFEQLVPSRPLARLLDGLTRPLYARAALAPRWER